MGNFLADVGRSNLLDVSNQMLGNVSGLLKTQADIAHQERAAGIQEAYLNMAKAEERRKAIEFQNKEANENRYIDITVTPQYLSLPPEQQSAALKYFSDSGYTDASGRGKVRDVKQGLSEIEGSKQLFSQFMGPVVESKKQAVINAWGTLQDAMATGDENKIASAKAEYNKARMDYESSSGNFAGHLEKLEQLEATQAAKPAEVKEFIGADGKWYQGTIKGKDAQGNPIYTNVVPYTPKPSTESGGLADDRKFYEITMKGVNATPEEKAWVAAYIKRKTLSAAARVEAFSNSPTNTPGVFFERSKDGKGTGRAYMIGADGSKVYLTSDQAKQMSLSYKEDTPVTNIKAMQQNAPSVLYLSREARKVVEKEIRDLGPVSSRWREFWAGKIGAPDPTFTKLKANLNLLQTKLSQMHVGAQGGIEMVKHFKETIESGKQSPENMLAALDAIESYANEVKQKKFSEGVDNAPPGGGSQSDPYGIR